VVYNFQYSRADPITSTTSYVMRIFKMSINSL
jgi:hypothetical protein